eukprot:CCRYP_011789-RA/>CCRYP_011789-RA protein AED:0.29 eAED:0.29 QI:183/1/0.5/1/0/0/2/0/125
MPHSFSPTEIEILTSCITPSNISLGQVQTDETSLFVAITGYHSIRIHFRRSPLCKPIMTSTGSASTSTAESITEPIVRKILTGVPVSTQADMLDLGSLHVSELNLLKKNDPFMYYSIPGATNPRL